MDVFPQDSGLLYLNVFKTERLSYKNKYFFFWQMMLLLKTEM